MAFGGNIGDTGAIFEKAHRALELELGPAICASSVYETSPLKGEGIPLQDNYLNAVICYETTLSAPLILELLQQVEKNCGRSRSDEVHWGPRTLDLDLVLAGDAIIDSNKLTIPHPRFYERDFVLLPLAEIAPRYLEPRTAKTIEELKEECLTLYPHHVLSKRPGSFRISPGLCKASCE